MPIVVGGSSLRRLWKTILESRQWICLVMGIVRGGLNIQGRYSPRKPEPSWMPRASKANRLLSHIVLTALLVWKSVIVMAGILAVLFLPMLRRRRVDIPSGAS